MAEEKAHIIYTAVEIQRYLSGKMTSTEMHELEKAALDDPFLSEAIEGYELANPEETSKAIGVLQDHFAGNNGAKVIPLQTNKRYSSWKAIAAILLVGSGIVITYLATNKKSGQPTEVAASLDKTTAPETTVTTLPKTDSITTSNTAGQTDLALNVPAAARKEVLASKDNSRVMRDSAFMYHPSAVQQNKEIAQSGGGYVEDKKDASIAATSNQSNQVELLQNNVAANAPVSNEITGLQKTKASARTDDLSANAKSAFINSYQFKGQVFGVNNTPIPFANVKITPGNQSTYADVNGNFTVIGKDSLAAIDIRSVGYKPGVFNLRSNVPNKIVLNEDEQTVLAETVIVGKKAAPNVRRRPVIETDSTMDAEPEDGWDNYDAYVYNNLQQSDEIMGSKIHGNVEISFDVKPNGEITNIKIDKSLCNDCDKEVMRILKEGPKWKVKKGRNVTAKMKVEF